jgi:peptidoglycan/xylan/chitin deacetylase (PgdA/CDA1 family)
MRLPKSIKYAGLEASQVLGLNSFCRALRRRQLLVVLYHGVISAEADPLGYCVHVGEFDQQIANLSRYFRPVSLAEVIAAAKSRARLPDRAVLVTFDDGYRNNLLQAAPILRKHGVPAVFHVTAGYIGTDQILWIEEICLRIRHWPLSNVPMPAGQPDASLPSDPVDRSALADRVSKSCKDLKEDAKERYLARLRQVSVPYGEDCLEEAYAFMSWDEVRRLQEQGFDIGSHTINHPILSALDPAAAAWELAESKRLIEERLGGNCLSVAYPNGRREDVSDAALEAARIAGYSVGFFGMDRFNRSLDSPYMLTRVNIPGYLPACVFHSRVSGLAELWH